MTFGWLQRSWWICGVAVLCCGGCAHGIWKKAQQEELAAIAEEEEVTFTETPLVKPREIAEPRTVQQPSAVAAKPAAPAARSAEDEALIDDTLARLRTLPDMKPEEVDQVARELRNPAHPIPRILLEQVNATAKYKQEQAQKQRVAAQTPAPTVAQPKVEEKPAPPASTVEEKPATAPTTTSDVKAAKPAPSSPSMKQRLRRAREGNAEPAAEKGIFNGKVGANAVPTIEPNMLAAHVANKLESENAADAHIAWDKRLAQAITALEAQLKNPKLEAGEATRLQTQLRFLYLAADRKEDALSEIEGLDAHEQDYWRSQLHAVSVLLAPEGTPVKGRRAALALRPLREAVDHLAAQATLDVKHVSLCKSVTIWGNYVEFEKYEFKPNQEVLLYFEVENFASEETAKGFATEFITSYELFDAAGHRVADQQFPIAQETCQNRRRDYFIRYHWHVPKHVSPGEYTLQLTVEDQKGHKFGQGSVKMKVVSGQ